VPQGELAPTADELREFLRMRMPDFMLPAAFVVLESMPLTASGKVDRKRQPPAVAPSAASKRQSRRQKVSKPLVVLDRQAI